MAYKSWDILIAGQQYVFAPSGAGIELGAALTEPGQPSQVGSVVIASLHGGIGRGFEDGILQYEESFEADLTVPTYLLPGFSVVAMGTFTPAAAPSVMRPCFGFGDGAATVWVIAGQAVQYFDPSAPGLGLTAATISGSLPLNSEFSGSAFQYNSELVLGVISTAAGDEGKPAAHAVIALGTPGTVTVDTTAGDEISYGASTRARAFWIEADTGLRWAPWVNGATFKDACTYEEKPSTGAGIEVGLPRASWLTMVGSSLLIMRQDGVILGADETGLLVVAGQTPLNGLEPNFGHRATPYHDGLLVPSRNGLWSFDLLSLTMRPASPNYIQGETQERLRGEITAASGAGPYGFVALRQVSSAGAVTSRAYMIVRYSNRIAVHDLIPETAANEVITDFLPFYDSATRRTLLYYLVYNESTDVVSVRYRPLKLPNDQHTAGTNLSSGSYVDLPSLVGPTPASNMTKIWTQVRGYFHKGASGAAHIDFSGFTVDGSTVTLATVSDDGPFAVPFGGTIANRAGRELTAGRVTLDDPVIDSRVDLPLTLDFVWVPSTQDALTVRVLVSGEVSGRVAAKWHDSPWATSKTLLDLRGTIVTLEFPEGDAWSVFVEGVALEDFKAPDGGGQTARVATVQMRRLT